ncbi:MAG: OsmC domain/YcaO domain-containing protein [Halobacteriovoraceae bacterium]|nr:OsmC domain/YcaO domain-containing protein [Halobacteriovoraceae bacterium]
MQILVRYLDNLKVEALFDDFSIIADQPIRYKGDGSAPGPFDYFLASSALCAAYFVKVYCKARDISTDDIRITQDNIIDPENRYKQTFNINVELPETISQKDREGIVKSIDRCTVKKTIQQCPDFEISVKTILGKDTNPVFDEFLNSDTRTVLIGKDCSLEETIQTMTKSLYDLGIKIEISSWRNPVPHVWSVHIRDADSPICFSNGKGPSKEAALCSALGEFFERLTNNYFYADYFLGQEIAKEKFVHYPSEKWFPIVDSKKFPKGLMDVNLIQTYSMDGDLTPNHLIDTNSGNSDRGICALPYIRQSDGETVYIPVNLIGNLFVSNGMSAGNTKYEARVQCLSEIFERAVKNQIILDEITLPDVPKEVLQKYPHIVEGIQGLEKHGYPILVKDASLGGLFPVMCVALMNPHTGGVFVSFGSHPNFEVALERSLTELMQGRSFEGLNDVPPPTFNENAITEHNNIIDHFIDSTGVVSWKFFSNQSDYEFVNWDFSGSTEEEFYQLMNILKDLEKEVYIADYNDFGVDTCRILVPDFSEIYQPEDLIWDNNNLALNFREDILNIHQLTDGQLVELVEKLEACQNDDFMEVSELIGIAFDDNSPWGDLVLGELKALIYLALKDYEQAKIYVEQFFTFNESSAQRKKYFQLINVFLDIELNELEIAHYYPNLKRMYGEELYSIAKQTMDGAIRFFGLCKTDLNFGNLDKQQRLIKSYRKIKSVRENKI